MGVWGLRPQRSPEAEPLDSGGAPGERPAKTDHAALAREALARAAEYKAAGDKPSSLRWLDRAARLAPTDPTIALTLAGALLGTDDTRAATLFAAVTQHQDVREAWLGLAVARRRLGDPAGAAAALTAVLGRHAFGPAHQAPHQSPHPIETLADCIAREAGAPGWCSLTADGVLTVRPMGAARLALRLDEQTLSPRIKRLPAQWERGYALSAAANGMPLLGSPIAIRAIRRVAGCVTARDGGLEGCVWHPADPDRDPPLIIQSTTGRRLTLTASDCNVAATPAVALARPRGFRVPAAALAGMPGPLHVLDQNGDALFGSPLDPGAEQRQAAAAAETLSRLFPTEQPRTGKSRTGKSPTGKSPTARPTTGEPAAPLTPIAPPAIPAGTTGPSPPIGATAHRRRLAVIIPVHGGTRTVLACLDSVLPTIPRGAAVLVVDDASPEPALRQALDGLAARRRIRLIRAPRARGFTASVNIAICACPDRDVVLLNSDTLVPPGWLERLVAAARAAPDAGTITPLSNDASILSYPGPAGSNPVPDLAATIRLDALAQRAGDGLVDIPVGVGFCLYIRRDCLDAVGLFRADLFAQGYGEENDFCLRARHLGWRHVAATGLFVAHVGGASFGGAGAALRARNQLILERLHPGYGQLVRDCIAVDPLAAARRQLDLARWRAARQRRQVAAMLVMHAGGGGVARAVAASAEAHRNAGRRAVVLHPDRMADGRPAVLVSDGPPEHFPNLRFAMPGELPLLLRLLRAEQPAMAELHHLADHHPAVITAIERLRVPYDVHVHDYSWFCPRIALVGAEPRYCGEPELPGCEDCVADAGSLLGAPITAAALRARSARLLAGAQRVLTPSADAATRLRRHFPAVSALPTPPEDDTARLPAARPLRLHGRNGGGASAATRRICVIGAIGVHKGYNIVLACARDAARRALPLEFVVVGHTIDDRRLLDTGRVFITGEYQPHEAVSLIGAQHASLALLPSIFPETWCYGLTEAWQAGLAVAAFDIGAPAERIRRTGRGLLLPLGLPPDAINALLMTTTTDNA